MELFLRELEGVSVAELQRCAIAEVEAHGRRLHIYTRDVALRLKEAGYQLIAISGSPQEILDLFLKPLGFDRAWGTVLAKDARGRYTGEVLENPFGNKRRVMEEFLANAEAGLEDSVGMGDTLSDVGFLEMVEIPIAFNPNRGLFEVARQWGWPIVVERKDVIYNLQTRLEDPVLADGTVWVG
jgi:phosphoserine phosphatase